MRFERRHQNLLDKLGASLMDLQGMGPKQKNRFIAENLVSYICGDGSKEEEEAADDIITMITAWEVGQLSDEGAKKMNKDDLRKIAKETIDITAKKKYKTAGGKTVELPDIDYTAVEVFSPERLQKIEDDENEFFERAFCGTSGADYYVVNADSYEAAKGLPNVLVMNFANAHRPGGGFLNGARAQEEALCRCSTLYASISSDKAKEMYDYNNKAEDPLDSDYMLLSRDVTVFRDVDLNLLDEPFDVSVVTVPAPNKNGRASVIREGEILSCMKNRLKKMLFMAAKEGYRNLILGAWGCGAFGNDPKKVAGIFHELFFDEGFDEFFETVCFAILGDMDKVGTFAHVFSDHLEDEDYDDFLFGYSDDDDEEEEGITFLTNEQDAPVLNHTLYATNKNIGYAQGIIVDGTPFEAELFEAGNSFGLAIYLPVFENGDEKNFADPKSKVNVSGFKFEDEAMDNSIMDIGMVDGGIEEDDDIIHAYVNYVVASGLVEFTTDMWNGYVAYRTDINGHDFAKILITLSEGDKEYAYPLMLPRPFVDSPKKQASGKVIEFKRK